MGACFVSRRCCLFAGKYVMWLAAMFLLVVGQTDSAAPVDWIERSPTGAFQYAYATGDEGGHYKTELATADNTVSGRYGSRDPATGANIETQYTAGRRGFRARGPNIARHMSLSQAGPIRPPDDGQYHPELDLIDPTEDRGFDYQLRTPTFAKEEHANALGDVRGRYSYINDAGMRHTVDYSAGANTGFNVHNAVPDNFVDAQASPLYFQGKSPGSKARGFTAIQKNGDGSYRFAAAGPDHKRTEISDRGNNVRGSYTYLDDKGVQRTVEYIAGPNIGFQVINNRRPFVFGSTLSPLGLLPTLPPLVDYSLSPGGAFPPLGGGGQLTGGAGNGPVGGGVGGNGVLPGGTGNGLAPSGGGGNGFRPLGGSGLTSTTTANGLLSDSSGYGFRPPGAAGSGLTSTTSGSGLSSGSSGFSSESSGSGLSSDSSDFGAGGGYVSSGGSGLTSTTTSSGLSSDSSGFGLRPPGSRPISSGGSGLSSDSSGSSSGSSGNGLSASTANSGQSGLLNPDGSSGFGASSSTSGPGPKDISGWDSFPPSTPLPYPWVDPLYGDFNRPIYPDGLHPANTPGLLPTRNQSRTSCCGGSWHTGPKRRTASRFARTSKAEAEKPSAPFRAHIQSVDVSQADRHMSPSEALDLLNDAEDSRT